MVTVGPFPSQLLWNVDAAQPSVLACQHLTNLLRPVVWSTGSKYEINLKWYLLPWLSKVLDELRASKKWRWCTSMRRSHTRYTEISSPCDIKSYLILLLLLSLLHQQIHIYIDGTYSITFLLNRIKLQNKEKEVVAKKCRLPPPPSPTSNVPKGGGYCKPKSFYGK